MPKRFTDSDKWHKNKWFRRLPRDGKLFWLFLCDSCDHAGIWDVDWEDAEYCLGGEVDRPALTELVKDRIVEVDDGEQWFIPRFVEFQYHGRLDESNRVHASIISRLTKYGIDLRLLKLNLSLLRKKQGCKDKDKDTPTLIPDPDPDSNIGSDANSYDEAVLTAADYPSKDTLESEAFVAFWERYGMNIERDKCWRYWYANRLDEIADIIMEALTAWKRSEKWANPKFKHHPFTWLEGTLWDFLPALSDGNS